MNKFFKVASVAAALAGAVVSVQAQTLTVSKFEPTPVDVYVLGSRDGGASYTGVLAQELGITTTSGDTFAAYCIDLINPRGGVPSPYKISQEARTDIAKLFAVAGFDSNNFKFDAVDTAAEKAGLQLAIWEVVDDSFDDVGLTTATGDAISAFTLGDFRIFGAEMNTSAAFSQAATYLNQAKGLTSGYQTYVNVLYSTFDPARQTLVTSVPEPTTYALMAACLGVVAFVSRRKQQA